MENDKCQNGSTHTLFIPIIVRLSFFFFFFQVVVLLTQCVQHNSRNFCVNIGVAKHLTDKLMSVHIVVQHVSELSQSR